MAASAPADEPALVEPRGWSHNWRKGGPILVAEVSSRWSHAGGGRQGDHLSAPRPSGPVRIQFVVTGNMDNVVEQEFIEAVERSIGLVGLRLGITGGDIMWSR